MRGRPLLRLMILADRLSRDYGPTHALRDVSLRVADGETVALLGPNGAGKSTLLQVLAGILPATGGSAEVAGLRVPGDEARLGEKVGYVPQGESVYPELSVRENIRFFGRMHGVSGEALDARAARLMRELRLEERADDRAGALSGGMRQRVAVASSLVHDPPVLLLDEPATGLDPLARERLGASLRALGGRGRAILFSTHSLDDAAALADRVVVLGSGRVAAELPASDLDGMEAAFRRLGGA